jgi:hypothetical protein
MKRIAIVALITTGIMLLLFASLLSGNIHIMLGMAMVYAIFIVVIKVLSIAEMFKIQSNREEHDIFRAFKRKKKGGEEARPNDPDQSNHGTSP